MIIPILYYTCSYTNFNTCIYKNVDMKNYFVRTKIRNKTMNQTRSEPFFLLFSANFTNKIGQRIIININKKIM